MVIGDWNADGAGFKSAKRYSIPLFTVLPLTHGCYKQGVGAAACRGLNLAAVEGRRGRAGSGVGCAFCVGHRPVEAGGAGGVVQAGVKLVGAFVLQAQRVRRWCTQFVPWVKTQANIVKSVAGARQRRRFLPLGGRQQWARFCARPKRALDSSTQAMELKT